MIAAGDEGIQCYRMAKGMVIPQIEGSLAPLRALHERRKPRTDPQQRGKTARTDVACQDWACHSIERNVHWAVVNAPIA